MFRAGSVLVVLLGIPVAPWWIRTCLAWEETAICLLVPGLVLWVVLQHVQRARPSFRTTMRSPLLVCLGMVGYALLLASGLAMPAMVCWIATLSCWIACWTSGRDFVANWLFPAILLCFAVPWYPLLDQFLGFQLRLGSAWLVGAIFEVFRFPVERAGTLVTVGRFSMSLEPACSGLAGVSVLLVLAILLGELTLRRVTMKLLLPVLVVLASLLSNTARILAIGLIGHWYGSAHAERFFHAFSGWMFFFVALVLLLLLLVLVQRWENRRVTTT